MPIRTSRSSSATADTKRAIAYHAAAITILWVVVLFMCLAGWLVMCVSILRIDALEKQVAMLSQQVEKGQMLNVLTPIVPAAPSQPAATTTQPAPLLPPAPTAASLSPSGLLDRGALSDDGSRYAGYDDVTKGHVGVAVEIVATKQVKHIVIFSPFSQSTGKGTPQETDLSVRWKDASTIEYDYLAKQGTSWVKKTDSVKIYF
jgi:hypothetical protein